MSDVVFAVCGFAPPVSLSDLFPDSSKRTGFSFRSFILRVYLLILHIIHINNELVSTGGVKLALSLRSQLSDH